MHAASWKDVHSHGNRLGTRGGGALLDHLLRAVLRYGPGYGSHKYLSFSATTDGFAKTR